jgi:hypothetical protein
VSSPSQNKMPPTTADGRPFFPGNNPARITTTTTRPIDKLL